MKDNDIINLTLGIFILKILTKCLKYIINQNRPNGFKGGMPSFMGALTFFISTYILLTSNIDKYTLLSIILFIIGTLSIKIYYKEHSLYQIFIGGIIGCMYSFIVYYLNK